MFHFYIRIFIVKQTVVYIHHFCVKPIQVGVALTTLAQQHQITRESLFVQTKFTAFAGQDPRRLPYDRNADLATQVCFLEIFHQFDSKISGYYIVGLLLIFY